MPGVTGSVPVTSAPVPLVPLSPLVPPAAPYRVNVAWLTRAGTVQYCAAPVQRQVTVAVAPLTARRRAGRPNHRCRVGGAR